ncbi:MAG: 3-hydroxyacyl-CoA dehydrogenase/enoyl-CoA hydratase family protein [Pseudomonadota bacterium]
MTQSTRIRKVAVLGAGVMGAQIAAHLVNARIPAVLFDLPSDGPDRSTLAREALRRLGKLKPAPFALGRLAQHVHPANYDDDLEQLEDCDLVIEAIAERMDWKKSLYEKILPHLGEHAILATNTSGLSINDLASVLPEDNRPRYCGIHFFNPPRYMHLAEVIPGATTDPEVVDQLESFLTTTLGKGVVRAKDTPNFIGNRIGVFSMLAAMHHTRELQLDFDVVDQLTGPRIGRPKSATYRTADVVGLDTMGHVIQTMADTLPDDPWHGFFGQPEVLAGLVAAGALGQKSGAGFYRKAGRTIEVLDAESGAYRESGKRPEPEVIEILKLPDPGSRLARLRAHSSAEARFLWACFRDLFHYCACHLEAIAETARDVDLAIRWGYGYQQGPFETWQAAGWRQVAGWIKEDISAGLAMSSTPLPEWVDDVEGVHQPGGSYSPSAGRFLPRPELAVYARQPFPDPMLGEQFDRGTTIHEDDAVRIWHRGDDVAIVSFRSKMNAISPGVIAGLNQAIDIAESAFSGLVIWQDSEPFSVGADLAAAGTVFATEGAAGVEKMVKDFQDAVVRLKTCAIPTVAAVRGMALGGGAEIVLHCDRTVAALESYIGLVEVGVGILPAGGGLAELAARASHKAAGGAVFEGLADVFQTVAMAKVSSSAIEAQAFGYLTDADPIVMHAQEILHVACETVHGLAQAGYQPALPDAITVAGDVGIANFKASLVNMLEGRFISEHDFEIGSRIATVLCGGPISRGSQVDRNWLLGLEREHFVALLGTEKTQARIEHMLKTGKPLRN